MRKTLLMSAALLSLAAPAAFAQATSGASVATPAPMPEPSATPPDTMASAMAGKPMHHAMMHAMMHPMKPTGSADIRPGHEPGVGDSFPASDKASNTTEANTKTTIAPRLPNPAGGENATPAMLLTDAKKALDARQSGRAQEALERAETAMLQRSVPADQASMPDQESGVTQVKLAREALAHGDMAGAKKAIAAAMAAG